MKINLNDIENTLRFYFITRCWDRHHLRQLIGAGILLLLLSPCRLTAQADVVERPNIIFILADDLGYGDLGTYGQRQIKSPNLDQLAREGMRFTDFYAGSTVCAPSRCVLVTGFHTGHAFIRGNGKDNLRPSDVTIAELLQQAGYTTGLIGKWGLGHEGSPGIPTRQGFDYFFGYLDQHHAHNYYPHFLVRNEKRVWLKNIVPNAGQFGQGVATKKVEYSHDLIVNEALRFVDRNQAKPFFLFLSLTIPHANNEAQDKGMEVPDHGIYANNNWPSAQKGHAAMITRMDSDIGRLINRLKKHGIDQNTIIFFTSDNGPHREGGHDPDFQNSNGPLRGIKRDLTDGGIRVPLIVRWHGKISAGTTNQFVGAFWDILPTLNELAGAADSQPQQIDGISFLPTLLGQSAQRQHEYLYWAFYERQGARAIRQGKWKAVQQPYRSPVRLYDLQQDLGESNNLADSQPQQVKLLIKLMEEADTPSARWQFPSQ